ncbi:hypothetical protein PIB30_041848 [Stylosanthes scabra]|uniref:Uncharacterized protein n=1 Tax=Stylosanthes scabra TaxID=79078 RepID=A0ABU6TF76_9FABA|nr:hypothetical protein [Stylosanthes scabra]
MMVGTRTTAREWQWLDEIMGEDAPAERLTQKMRACPRVMDVGEGGVVADLVEAAGRGVTRRLPGRLRVVPAPIHGTEIPSNLGSPSQPWLDGLSGPGFQLMISEILIPVDVGCWPENDGTQFDGSQVHIDLNEPVSGPSHVFMALGGTPLSAAHVPGGSWKVPFMAPATVLTPPASPAPAEQPDEPATCGWARRVPRRRGCSTGGHM